MTPSAPLGHGDRTGSGPDGPTRLELFVPAQPVALPGVRTRLREWLSALAWPEPDADDVVMAVSEACTNAVEHAYRSGIPGQVAVKCDSVEAGEGKRQVVVLVRDWGRWRPAQGNRGFRGHGLSMMRGCMQTVRFEHGDRGTVVTLASFAVPS